ncbi:YolD-like family protein [Bacillus cereus group sp. BceL062]|uniref:YolD-like family protein n=1 Tax=Bacillus cereus group TaxID=86661 RepID=UPI0032191EAB
MHSQQTHEKIFTSHFRDGIVHNMYINVLHIEPMTRTLYCTNAFGLNTDFTFNELVNIN